MHHNLNDISVSAEELRRDYERIIRQAEQHPIAILNHDQTEAYLLPVTYYERLMAHLEDLEDAALVRERESGPFVDVRLDEL
jgi:antitoxin StbD